MAELNSHPGLRRSRSSARRKPREAKKPDMTAMVDVAFLLLAFFVMTTTISVSNQMRLNMPPEAAGPIDVQQSKMLSIYLHDADKVTLIYGDAYEELVETNFSKQKGGLRDAIWNHLQQDDPIVSVKPAAGSSYSSLVHTLDELHITGAPKYAVAKWTAQDSVAFGLRMPDDNG